MTITNGYVTLDEYKKNYQRIGVDDVDPKDDDFIEQAIEAASRWIDRETATQFYASTETRYFDVPDTAILDLDKHCISITTLTNGDGTTIASSSYVKLPANVTPFLAVQLKSSKNVSWETDADGETLQVISVYGSWGYSATAPADLHLACLEIARALYGRRFGQNMTMKTVITPAGVVQIPEGVPDWAAQVIGNYRRIF